MKIDQLRQLLEVSRTNSINQAAINLYISQPNLSLSLRNLEAEIGYPLLTRNNRGVALTPKGKQFVEYAESVLIQLDHLKTLYGQNSHQEQFSLSIGNMHFRYVTEVAAILYDQHRESNPFRLNMKEGDRDEIVNFVYHGDVEIGMINIWTTYRKVTNAQMRAKNIQYYRLASNAPAIVLGPGNPLYTMPDGYKVALDLLRNFPCVMYEEQNCGTYSNVSELLGLGRTSGEIVVDSRAMLYELMENTPAFTITSTNRRAYQKASYYPRARSFEIADETGISCDVGWIKRRDYTPSPLVLEFLQLVSSYY